MKSVTIAALLGFTQAVHHDSKTNNKIFEAAPHMKQIAEIANGKLFDVTVQDSD